MLQLPRIQAVCKVVGLPAQHYPQSNGLAEKNVQTAKRILTKAKEDKKDPYLCLLEYRNTPVDGLKSPAQILMSRRLRSILPTTTQQLRPQVAPETTVHARREDCQQRQKQHYDRSTRPMSTLHTGAPIRFQQEDGTWKPATVIRPAETPRSYHIQTSEGQSFRRNRRHLLDNNSPITQQPEAIDDDPSTTQESPGAQHHHTESKCEPVHTEPCQRTRFGRIIKPRQVLDL